VYVGNLSYEVKYRDLIEFMRGGGWGRFSSWSLLAFYGCGGRGGSSGGGGFDPLSEWSLEVRRAGAGAGTGVRARRHEASSVVPA
jgi:hypothetical protein